jgi:DNA-directed RNA polymerase specialized sigma24 family protein
VLTARKVAHAIRDEHRLKRGGGEVVDESVLADAAPDESRVGLDALRGSEPTPEFAAQVAEECRRLLALLCDEKLRFIAVSRMEGFSNEEIASKLGCSARTIDHRLEQIRELWSASAST